MKQLVFSNPFRILGTFSISSPANLSLITSFRWFANSSVILFLNKTDLFKLKLISSPIYEFYSDYEGPSDYRTAISYMESKFRPLYRNGDKHPLICHQTCATGSFIYSFAAEGMLMLWIDSDQLKLVFEAVEESILIASLADSVSFLLIFVIFDCVGRPSA